MSTTGTLRQGLPLSPRAQLAYKLVSRRAKLVKNGEFVFMRPETGVLRKALKRGSGYTQLERQLIYSWLVIRRQQSRRKRHG